MTINDLVKEYKLKILDFMNVFELKMTIDDVQRYLRNYKEQLIFLKNLRPHERRYLISASVKVINEIVDFKRNLGLASLSGRAEIHYNYVKSEFSKDISSKLSNVNTTSIVDIIFQSDPWDLSQPKNDEELMMHEKWWIDIQLWKNFDVLNEFFQLPNSMLTNVKRGRSFNKDAPQEVIEDTVAEIIGDKRFIGKNGPKPTTIRDYLIDPFHQRFDMISFTEEQRKKHNKVSGGLKETQLYERVKMALKNIR